MRVWANMHMSFCRDWNKRCKPDIGKIILKCKTEKLIEKKDWIRKIKQMKRKRVKKNKDRQRPEEGREKLKWEKLKVSNE